MTDFNYPLARLTVHDQRWLHFAALDYCVVMNDLGATLWEDLLTDQYGRTVWRGGHQQMEINLLKADVTPGGYLYDPHYDPRSYAGPLREVCRNLVARRQCARPARPLGAIYDPPLRQFSAEMRGRSTDP